MAEICYGFLSSITFSPLAGYFAPSDISAVIAAAEAEAQAWLSIWTTTNQARSLLTAELEAQAVSSNSGCMSYLEKATGKSFSQLMQDADQVSFIDVAGASGTLTLSNIGLPGGGETLSQYFDSAGPTAVAITPTGYPVVLLGSSYFNSSGTATIGNQTVNLPATTASQEETLLHEFFHTEGIGDLGGTTAFDSWLQGGCKGAPPSQ
jgi:hypothetical protein